MILIWNRLFQLEARVQLRLFRKKVDAAQGNRKVNKVCGSKIISQSTNEAFFGDLPHSVNAWASHLREGYTRG